MLAGAGGGEKLYSYVYMFNGFAAGLTAQQAAARRRTQGVVSVTKAERSQQLDTSTTPGFLGLTGPGRPLAKSVAKGEGMIIGIVDSGVWPENPSFSDRTGTNGNAHPGR